jgi:hypothetical protein
MYFFEPVLVIPPESAEAVLRLDSDGLYVLYIAVERIP